MVQAAEEKGVPSVGYNSDLSRFGPKTCTTSITNDWNAYYLARVKAVLDGNWASGDTWEGVATGMLKMSPLGTNVPAPARAAFEGRTAELKAGKPVFAGPIKDQAGQVRVAAGAVMEDKDILAMSWLAEGVQGKV